MDNRLRAIYICVCVSKYILSVCGVETGVLRLQIFSPSSRTLSEEAWAASVCCKHEYKEALLLRSLVKYPHKIPMWFLTDTVCSHLGRRVGHDPRVEIWRVEERSVREVLRPEKYETKSIRRQMDRVHDARVCR